MRVITWNLFHGRAVPERRHDLYNEFLAAIAGWEWDVLMLQEAPPWWPERFAAALGVTGRAVRTSRNFGLPIRRAIATRRPDLIKANGGGSNAILVRDQAIVAHRYRRIRWLPERRLVHGVRLASGVWICNLHMQGSRSHLVAPSPVAETAAAGAAAREWAGEQTPIVLGGDWNVTRPEPPGFELVPGHRGVDQLLVRNLGFEGKARALDRGELSDHRPVCAKIVE